MIVFPPRGSLHLCFFALLVTQSAGSSPISLVSIILQVSTFCLYGSTDALQTHKLFSWKRLDIATGYLLVAIHFWAPHMFFFWPLIKYLAFWQISSEVANLLYKIKTYHIYTYILGTTNSIKAFSIKNTWQISGQILVLKLHLINSQKKWLAFWDTFRGNVGIGMNEACIGGEYSNTFIDNDSIC